MSPLKLALLLRAYSSARPNMDLPTRQAFAPAMMQAVHEFRARDLLRPEVHTAMLVTGWLNERGAYHLLITPKGEALAQRILAAAEECYKEATE
jgi:hypothetical protein